MTGESRLQLANLASDLTIAWLSNGNNRASIRGVTDVLKAMTTGLQSITNGADEPSNENVTPTYEGAVTARKSLASPDRIISMIDGKPYSSLNRHLAKAGLTPTEYRQRYGLKADYPMVAPGYSERRRAIAMEVGLGRTPGQKAASRKATKPKQVRK